MDTALIIDLRKNYDEWFHRIVEIFQIKDWPKPQLDFLSLKGTVAGRAMLQENKIKFNFSLYIRNKSDFVNDTIPHELVHCAAWQLYKHRETGHGIYWSSMMRKLGLAPKRCHNYDTKVVTGKKNFLFQYICGCGNITFSQKDHNILLTRRVLCVKCKTPYVYKGII